MAETFIIDKEESFGVCDGTAEGRAKIILDEKFGAAHIAEGVSVHGAAAQEFVSGTVELIGAAPGDDIDLAAAGAAHFSGVAAGLPLEFLYGIGRVAESEGIDGGDGVARSVEEELVS